MEMSFVNPKPRQICWDPKKLFVQPILDTLVLNVRDMVEGISEGSYRSNPHLVLNTGKQRFSIPFFAASDC
jgi:isopenicillin N synthase-like dioxygenase